MAVTPFLMLVSVLSGCGGGTSALPVDASNLTDVMADDSADVRADVSPEVNADATPDSTPDGMLDATPDAASCVDIAGAWEWTGSCTDPHIQPTPECDEQTGCAVTVFEGRPNARTRTLVGNTLTFSLTQAEDELDGSYTATYTGDTAVARMTITAPITATCMFTGRRVRFAGATRYCCDVGRTDCGAGQRCTVVGVGTNNAMITTACVADGTLARGEACTRVMPIPGSDRCSAGNYCGNYDNTTPTTRTCQQLCASADECAAGQHCGLTTYIPRAGMCRRRCTLRGTDCPGTSNCRPIPALVARDGRMQMEPTCLFTGTATEGMPCADSLGCVANHVCQITAEGGVCREVCDAMHACRAGTRCQVFEGGPFVTNPTGLGACVPMM